MFEQFKIAYDIHPWLRRAAWAGLPMSSLLLLRVSGGFPPQAWRLLAQATPRVTYLWSLHGPALLLPYAALVTLSLTWLVAWGLLLGACAAMVHHWRQSRHERQRFDMERQEAYKAATQELAAQSWPDSRGHLHIVSTAPGQAEAVQQVPLEWQRQSSFQLDIGSGWDRGVTRKDAPNEDSLVAIEGRCIYNEQLRPFGLFVVADGMGGHANGQDASYLTIQTVVQFVLSNIVGSDEMTDETLSRLLVESIEEANRIVYKRGQEIRSDMGATITATLVVDRTAFVANVGDSRTYFYRELEGLVQVTRDHSVVARLVAAGQISPEAVYTHPARSHVYRGLGAQADVEVDMFTLPLQADDRLLLCSDGLWEMVRNPEIERILKKPAADAAQTSKDLVQAALKGGGSDNISVIIVHLRLQ
jgi:serine/threonine protein phosphatase PrpC